MRLLGTLALTAILLLCGSLSCAKEKQDITEDLVSYLFFCGGGVNACYAECGRTWDLDGSGRIEPVEQPQYDSCTGVCDGRCSLTFLSTLTN